MSCLEKCSAEKDEVRKAAEGLIAAGKKGSVSVNGPGCDFPAHVSVTFKNADDAAAYHAALLSLILVLAYE